MSLKVAIVGCGKIADGHVEEIQKLPQQASVTACCDLEPLLAEQLAVRYGIPAHYADFDELLARERPDVVHITTPPQSHLALARKSLAAGAHIYVEKPLAVNSAEAHELVAAAVQAGRKLTVGYWYNFEPPALALRKLVSEGVLGEIVHIESSMGYNLAGAFGAAFLADPTHWLHRLPGKLFQNVVDHIINKAVLLVPDGNPAVHAIAYRRRETLNGTSSDSVLDELRTMLIWPKTSAYCTLSSHAQPFAHSLRVYGTRQSVDLDFHSKTLVFQHGPTLPSAIGRLLPPLQQGLAHLRDGGRNLLRFGSSQYHFFDGMNRLISSFYDSILEDTPVPISYAQMLTVSDIMEDIFTQINQRAAEEQPA